jgi:hypothetical protein
VAKSSLSAGEARRIALAAQGLSDGRPGRAIARAQLLRTLDRLGVVQIDSVNVVSRTHYLPFFSRLGPYSRELLDQTLWGRPKRAAEYWAHEAAFIPVQRHPLFRWRMDDARRGIGTWKGVASFLRERRDLVERALEEVRDRGPMTASELELGERRTGGWWGWSDPKRALECLFWAGELTTATRRGTFERVYGLTDKVLPRSVVEAPTPTRQEAHRQLIVLAARAMGVATAADLRDYFRMPVEGFKTRLDELVEAGELAAVTVEGWRGMAYLDPEARRPRRATGQALLSPFDNLIWFRDRTERLFGIKVRLEIYTPAHKREHGYYVLPFLEGEKITARVDLKADRKAGGVGRAGGACGAWRDGGYAGAAGGGADVDGGLAGALGGEGPAKGRLGGGVGRRGLNPSPSSGEGRTVRPHRKE